MREEFKQFERVLKSCAQHCSRQGVHTREGGEEEADSDADGSDVKVQSGLYLTYIIHYTVEVDEELTVLFT